MATAMHARLGMLTVQYNGYSNPVAAMVNFNAVDLEYEIFVGNRRSVAFRFLIAPDLNTNKVRYTYAGIGQRFYIGTKGMLVDSAERDMSVMSLPRWRFLLGWDAGLAQTIVQSRTSVLDVIASLYDLGVVSGLNYRLSERLNLETSLGASFGYGFSSVSVNAIVYKILVGVNYFF